MLKIEMLSRIVVLFAAVSCLNACATVAYQQSQPVIEASDVSKIQKGVTTRPEVEAIFGRPAQTVVGDKGERHSFYSAYQASVSGKAHASAYIPFVGPLVGTGEGSSTHRQQTLQVIYTAAGVVKDFEFSETGSNSKTQVKGLTQSKTETTPMK
ncbi:MAG: hypothetical protein EPO55_20310 [Reyranella sp.]|uniref:hypothetical protein n=1 Tax=Reyranella sp. TaxID=1929291 RepID=UPI0012289630|nr:hypothetical protein [Reyranella sp.]TAJ36871.1 MAG: hypothetical protein EPO55_20310 [Reyranella sp.]